MSSMNRQSTPREPNTTEQMVAPFIILKLCIYREINTIRTPQSQKNAQNIPLDSVSPVIQKVIQVKVLLV